MRGRRWALLLLLPLGAGLGVLIAGIPNISPDMKTSVAAGRTGRTIVPTTTTTRAAPDRAPPVHPPAEVVLIVLNGAAVDGAAGDLTAQFKELGYKTLTPSSTDPRADTLVFFRQGYEGDAMEAAAAIHSSVVTEPLDPTAFAGVEDAHLVVVIGEDYRGFR